MGYGDQQMKDLETTIANTVCDVVIIGTPIDLRRVISINHPTTRVTYSLGPDGSSQLEEKLNLFCNKQGL